MSKEENIKKKKLPAVAVKYANTLRSLLQSHVKSIFLIGSQARGDAHAGSDYDFIVVLDRIDSELRDKIVDAGVTLMDETDQLCAPLVYNTQQWERIKHSPLGWNVLREGVAL